ncbi:hypothetical protein [Aulosira sp. FACHB-615]|uniref:hypothetical protein n=1 Tax=Aulosira sp. FACHB-615 TaxID=2692777 RepID=UPI0016864E94|nr:hypothetical protein [Aulosira sp. FACHB-615]MBD2488953.1 hypothetical protein [Aulosira sp. FACHB-615]
MLKKRLYLNKNLLFVLAIWLFSRLLIATAMLIIAPLIINPSNATNVTFGWDVFLNSDSEHYQKIATVGYDFSVERQEYSVAFFPLFPMLSRAIMSLGLPFIVAGTIVNNVAFLIALIVAYLWINEFYGIKVARWMIAVLVWFPMSLFGTVIYSEGLYLLFSTAALRAFDKQQNLETAIFGTLATATRPTGIALVTACLLTAWKEKRGIKTYIASLATSGGILLYSLYCQVKFGDALAFFHAQKAWRPSLGFYWQGWLKMLMQITVGQRNWSAGYLKDPWHPLLFLSIVICSFLLWYFRKNLDVQKLDFGFYALILLLWLLAGDPLINTITILGGTYLLWHCRSQLTPITLIYGCCSLGLIFASGGTWSLNRLAYGVISLTVALGLVLSRYPRWGYATVIFFGILLASVSVRFAQNLWVA